MGAQYAGISRERQDLWDVRKTGKAVFSRVEACAPPELSDVAPSRIEQLPQELLDYILSFLERSAVLSLGLCSRFLWKKVMAHARDEVRLNMGCWAGTPVICGATTLQDFPDVLQTQLPNQPAADIRIRRAMSTYLELERRDTAMSWRAALDEVTSSSALRSSLERALHITHTIAGSRWLLRNLSTNEFVWLQFSRDISAAPTEPDWGHWLFFPKCVHIEDEPLLSLDAALVMRTAWTGIDPADGPIRRPTRNSVWAGHRFDVIRGGEFDEEGWEIVTEVVEEARRKGLLQAPKYGRREASNRATALKDPMEKMLERDGR